MTNVNELIARKLLLSPHRLEKCRRFLCDFIVDKTTEAEVGGKTVLGLSGGIDSTLVAHLAVEALGPDKLLGLVMPSKVNRSENMSDAERVARMLDIDCKVIDIEPMVQAQLAGDPETEFSELAIGNLRARIRADQCYLYANQHGRLVLGTGNLTEALVGYFTKYGDGAVDAHPIGRLYKCQVRQLADYIGVPDDLVNKIPTAGLWEGQTDEGELDIDYDTLDLILYYKYGISVPRSIMEIAEKVGVATEDVEHVIELHDKSVHKREVPSVPDHIPMR